MLQLKNVKIQEILSEETTCFSAHLYFKNHEIATVKNEGRGGENRIEWNNREARTQMKKDIHEYLKANGVDHEYPELAIQSAIDRMVYNFQRRKLIKKYLKKKTDVVVLQENSNQLYHYKLKEETYKQQLDLLKNRYQEKHGFEIFTIENIPEVKI